jgi:SAM-dependent methyltransferase
VRDRATSAGYTHTTHCRSCGSVRLRDFLELGDMPLSDNLLAAGQLDEHEPRFPLTAAFCSDCTLVQIRECVDPTQLFVDNYLYFSSYSELLLDHSQRHAESLIAARGLTAESLVVEVASNDGYLLRNFVAAGIPVLGIDPAPAQAAAAVAAGVPTIQEFFGLSLARRIRDAHGAADVVIANNVMAHVPELNDFVGGIAALVADDGVVTVENPYVRDLVSRRAFDTIYHEHFYYYSCTSVDRLARRHGLRLVDVEYFPALHAGTLRWHLAKTGDPTETVAAYLAAERQDAASFASFTDFASDVDSAARRLTDMLRQLKAEGATIAAYGAAAKGAILLNYAGIGADLVDFVVDRNPHKVGRFMPGVHIPIRPVEALVEAQPDYTLLLSWNFRDEIVQQQRAYRDRGGRFVVPLPEPEVVS